MKQSAGNFKQLTVNLEYCVHSSNKRLTLKPIEDQEGDDGYHYSPTTTQQVRSIPDRLLADYSL